MRGLTLATRVLIVDDNEDHRYLTSRALREGGSDVMVDTVAGGAEALDYLYRRGKFEGQPRPHIIFLDLKMPKVDGFEVLAELQADNALRTIPVVVLT